LLGNGDGTFQTPVSVANDTSLFGTVGDFNNDGLLDFAGDNLYLQLPLVVSPTSLNFANQAVGTQSQPQVVTITNTSSSAIPITNIAIEGTNSGDFAQQNNCPSSLTAGASCQAQVTFQPQAVGQRSADLSISYSGTGSPQQVSLSGVGTTVTVSLTPSQLSFAAQLIGTQSKAQTATLTNTGTGAVAISSISTTGPFAETNNCPANLAPNASCQIQVQFAPTDPGPASGDLYVYDNAQGSPQSVVLSGTGTVVKLSPLSINFGNQQVGTSSAPVPVTLTNVWANTLQISDISIGGTNPGDFSQTNDCGSSVPPNSYCTIQVTFSPQMKGPRSASLQISDNGGGSPQMVPLRGTGT
jgi:hypothetical protein